MRDESIVTNYELEDDKTIDNSIRPESIDWGC